jgi:hypothetical protein
MANSKEVKPYSNYITVDTNPGVGGYYTDPISVRTNPDKIRELYFSVREESTGTSVVVPTLQFRCEGDANWTDYYNDGTSFKIGDRVKIYDNGPKVQWRAGVKQNAFTSGKVRIGFDW